MGSTPIYSIPFADPTDLVRDWPALSEDVAEAVEAAVAGVPVIAGIGSNVVQTVKTDTFSTTSTSFTTVTGLTATITPTTLSSKILILIDVKVGNGDTSEGANATHVRLAGGNSSAYIGDAASNRVRSLMTVASGSVVQSTVVTYGAGLMYLDSPSSTSPTTYSVEMRRGVNNTAAFLNRSGLDTDNENFGRTASSITLIEVAA